MRASSCRNQMWTSASAAAPPASRPRAAARGSCRSDPRTARRPGPVSRGGVSSSRRAQRLAERLAERAADRHRLADRLHLRGQPLVGAGELLEREPRHLHDDVVERRLEAGRRGLREVVRDLVQRVADGELRGDLRDRVAGRLRGQRRRPRHARVHLDHDDLAGLAVDRELHVRAAGLDADGADDGHGRVAQRLVLAVGQRHRRAPRRPSRRCGRPSDRGSRSSRR